MGQGFSLATPSVGSAGIDISELSDVHFEKSIGNARFMKSIRGRHENGLVLVKVLVKPYADVKLQQYKKQIIGNLRTFSTPSSDVLTKIRAG
jgi:phosphoinositide-3-kinase regulatory subunit 4